MSVTSDFDPIPENQSTGNTNQLRYMQGLEVVTFPENMMLLTFSAKVLAKKAENFQPEKLKETMISHQLYL